MQYEKDEVTHIRFGGFGTGSETWIKGAKLKPAQVKSLQQLLKDHLQETGEKPSSFGRRVLGDSGAIPRLFEGTDPRLSTMHKILKAIGVKK